ncbi:MAG: hypothetical protein JNM86_10380 [Phycisphaerae bacterium]|nr:hypothetical protein [Phycisphaerae bacterium]
MKWLCILSCAVACVLAGSTGVAANPPGVAEAAKVVWLDAKNHLKVEALTLGDGRFSRTYIDTNESPERINSATVFNGNSVIDQTLAAFTEAAAKPEEWVSGRGATAVMECPWPMVAKWDELLETVPDRVSEISNGIKLVSSEKLGLALARDLSGNLQSVRFTFGSGPKATYIQDDYSDFRATKGRLVPYQRIRTFNPRPDGNPGNPPQHYELQSVEWNPSDAVELLAYRKGKEVFDKKDISGNVYAPDGRFKYNEKQLMADMMAASTGSRTRRSWATWIVVSLVAGVVGLIVLKYRKGW